MKGIKNQNQIKFPELKTIVSEMKNILDEIKDRLDNKRKV